MHHVGEGMDSKGLDVCNSLERDKSYWCCCCRDRRKATCHDGPNSLTVGLRALLAPAQFIATKLGEEAETGPAEYLAVFNTCMARCAQQRLTWACRRLP